VVCGWKTRPGARLTIGRAGEKPAVRLAYFSDVHDRFETVTDAMGAIGDVDLIVIGGDITSRGTADDAARALELWRPLAPRLLAVSGNWDSAAIDALLARRGAALDGRGVVLGETGLCGASGSPPSTIHSPYELEEVEILRRLERGFAAIEGCRVRVVCPHAPPVGTTCDQMYGGDHIGSSAVRSFIERRRPELVLCGHVHEARGFDRIDASLIVNSGAARDGHHAVVAIENGEVEVSLDAD